MQRSHSRLASAALLAATAISSLGAAKAASISNGVYAVLREGHTRAEVETEKQPHFVLVYDRKYSDADRNQPPKYVALDSTSFVPLVLAGPPDARKDDRGLTLLHIKLAPQHVKTLEDFTRTHLDGVVAIVIDSEIVTMHKVRTVIKDGEAKITRCFDDACQSLLLKLAPPKTETSTQAESPGR